MSFKKILLLLSLTLLTTACVTGTRNIALEVPQQINAKERNGEIQIISINDLRTFEQKPRNPSTPSVNGDLASTSPEIIATLIGRQRNGYGAAMGDIALPEGDTIQNQVRNLLSSGLEKRGYAITESASNKLNIDIQKFWAWFVPGMWSVGFESELETKLSLDNGTEAKSVTVAGKGNNRGQVASDANWQLTYQRAFEDFQIKLEEALESLGL